jgi:hypothetical protein
MGDESDFENATAPARPFQHEVHRGLSAVGIELPRTRAQSIAHEMRGYVLGSTGQLTHDLILSHSRPRFRKSALSAT